MKRADYETVHDENLFAAKLLVITAIIIAVYKTVKGLFMGNSLVEGFVKSWLSGVGIGLFVFVLIGALGFYNDWAIYDCMKRKIINKGSQHEGTIVSEIEKRKARKGVIHLTWKYVVRLDDGSEVVSTSYTEQILEKKCTVYLRGAKCILTNFRDR